ncbi:MAG: aldose epimerase [Synechococcaceae cyanobacterium SM2_3_1]|nr:aldose epimerase [Synechococcaceae cyanobacterium SM2_3_1]
MLTITQEQRQYLTYMLTDTDADTQIEVVPERGGIVTHWRFQGQELFYLDAERFLHPDLTVRGGIPILFPICGNLPDNQYTHAGQTFELKQHGFGRNLPWQVLDQSTDGGARLAVQLKSNEETLASYPFAFELTYTYELIGNRLILHFQVVNLSEEVMPFVSGIHPYFSVKDKSQLQFQLPAAQYWDHQSQETVSFAGEFDLTREEIDVALKPLTDQVAVVTDTGAGTRLTLRYQDPVSTLVFWTVKGKDFYCLEPWTAPRQALVTGDHLLQLQPQQSLAYDVSFEIARI